MRKTPMNSEHFHEIKWDAAHGFDGARALAAMS